MSRSRRRSSIIPVTTTDSEAADKRCWHKRFRAATRRAIQDGQEVMPDVREVSNRLDMGKDGHMGFAPKKRPDLARK